MELLRFSTAGSVDDGKSTLIGRILYDTGNVYKDQLKAVTDRKGKEGVDLALITDGLASEREQGITIDVAYRYFSSDKRKYIIADTPGHEQYTRNMVTGASTSDVAIILIDARKGVLPQTKRHSFISSLLGIPRLVVAVNKMDLMNYSQEVFENIKKEYMDFAEKLQIHDITFVPISALEGDNVVFEDTQNMPWYTGQSIMHYLDSVEISTGKNLIDFRMPIQMVIRPNQDYRGYAGMISSGAITQGEEIMVLPSKKTAIVSAIDHFDGELEKARAGQSISICLDRELDISRGDMIVRPGNLPMVSNSFEAFICWMDEDYELAVGRSYEFKHSTQRLKGRVKKILYKIDVNTLHREEVDSVQLNEIAKVEIEVNSPLFFDPYTDNRDTGSFIMIDLDSNKTVSAGMIKKVVDSDSKASNVQWQDLSVGRNEYEDLLQQQGKVLWFTGLSGSGKSTIANAFLAKLHSEGKYAVLLDGDNIRHGLCADLGFSADDRKENLRRIREVAKILVNQGAIVLCTFITPYESERKLNRELLGSDYLEIFVDCPLEECQKRDPKGLYAKVANGEISNFTGIDSPFERPETPDAILESNQMDISKAVETLSFLLGK